MITYEDTLGATNLQKNILKALIRSRDVSQLIDANTRECEITTKVTSIAMIAFFTTDYDGGNEDKLAIVKKELEKCLLSNPNVEVITLSERNRERIKPLDDYFILRIRMHQDVIYRYGFVTRGSKIFFKKPGVKNPDRELFYYIKDEKIRIYKKLIDGVEEDYRNKKISKEQAASMSRHFMDEIDYTKKTIYVNPNNQSK